MLLRVGMLNWSAMGKAGEIIFLLYPQSHWSIVVDSLYSIPRFLKQEMFSKLDLSYLIFELTSATFWSTRLNLSS